MLTRKKVQTTILLAIGIVLLLNIIASKFFFRLDYTADQRYTLSKATKDRIIADHKCNISMGKEVKILDVKLSDKNGKIKNTFEVEEPLTIQISLQAYRNINNVEITCCIYREDGVRIHGTNNVRFNIPFSFKKGENSLVELRYHKLMLLQGTYYINIGLTKDSLSPHRYDEINRACYFTVNSNIIHGIGTTITGIMFALLAWLFYFKKFYSLTKFINGKNDCVAGAICTDHDFINTLSNINSGTLMLLGPVLDSLRASSILKNLHTLHIRMKQHSKNAMYLAVELEKMGISVFYPGLSSHPQHKLMTEIMNEEFGYGGMLAIDIEPPDKAKLFMEAMQNNDVGYLAVSLGYFKTLFSHPGRSTSSELPKEFQHEIGLKEGLIRMSIGLDNDIQRTLNQIKKCLKIINFDPVNI